MASNTARFGLLKKDPVADGADTFNIETMLNDNWDKLDEAAKKEEVDAKYTKPAGGIPKLDLSSVVQASLEKADSAVQDVSGLATKTELKAHQAETMQGAHKAKNIAVTDTDNLFTGADVESVLKELFTFANNGKTDIAGVIGSPATSGDAFAQLKTHIQNSKNTLATNLTAKGTSAAGTEALSALAAKVANVNTGKKWAKGSYTWPVTYLNTAYSVTIPLDFTPKTIMFRSVSGEMLYDGVATTLGSESTMQHHAFGIKVNADNSFFTYLRKTYGTGGTPLTLEWIAFE